MRSGISRDMKTARARMRAFSRPATTSVANWRSMTPTTTAMLRASARARPAARGGQLRKRQARARVPWPRAGRWDALGSNRCGHAGLTVQRARGSSAAALSEASRASSAESNRSSFAPRKCTRRHHPTQEIEMRTAPCLASLAFAALDALALVLAPAQPGSRGEGHDRRSRPCRPRHALVIARHLRSREVERAALEQQPQVLVARAATSVAQAQAESAAGAAASAGDRDGGVHARDGQLRAAPGRYPPAAASTPPGMTTHRRGNRFCDLVRLLELRRDRDAAPLRLRADLRPEVRAAKTTVEAQQLTEQTTRLQVRLSGAASAYFNARAMQGARRTSRARRSTTRTGTSLQVQGFVQVGTQPRDRARAAEGGRGQRAGPAHHGAEQLRDGQGAAQPGRRARAGHRLRRRRRRRSAPVDDEDQPLRRAGRRGRSRRAPRSRRSSSSARRRRPR